MAFGKTQMVSKIAAKTKREIEIADTVRYLLKLLYNLKNKVKAVPNTRVTIIRNRYVESYEHTMSIK